MKRLNKNMNGDNPAFYRLPENSRLAAQYLLLYELSVPFGMDLNNRINVAKSATRMTVTLKRLKSEELRALEARGQKWLSANAPGLAKEASGYSLIFAHLAIRNTLSMLWGTLIGMILISLILIGIFKSLRLGLISLVPNLIPAAMAFGVWGYLYSEVGPAGSLVTAIAFGIVVDDTIHFMSKYLKGRREGLSASDAVRTTFRSVGFALFSTTSILVLGFLVFATSGFAIHLDARPPGGTHAQLRADPGSVAPAAPADGPRPEDAMIHAHRMNLAAVVISEAGRLDIFTPMYFILARKPEQGRRLLCKTDASCNFRIIPS